MSSNSYLRGEVVRIALSLANTLGAAVDPGELLIKVRAEGQAILTYTYGVGIQIVRDALGEYHIDLPLPTPGTWYYRWEFSGANAGANEGSITVDPGYF